MTIVLTANDHVTYRECDECGLRARVEAWPGGSVGPATGWARPTVRDTLRKGSVIERDLCQKCSQLHLCVKAP